MDRKTLMCGVPKRKPGWFQYTWTLIFGLPFALAGFLCCITVVLALPGILLMIIGSLPFYCVHSRSIAWETRDQPLNEHEGPFPWEGAEN